MGLQDVKDEILEEADARAEEIIEEAEAEKEQILEDAKAAAETIVDEAEQDAQEEADAIRNREIAAAKMDARKQRLAAREEALSNVFNQFRGRVTELGEDAERELIEAALDRLSDKADIGTVYADAAFEDTAAAYGTFEERDIRGVIVETADGTRQFDLRFDAVADDVIEEYRQEVADVVFEE